MGKGVKGLLLIYLILFLEGCFSLSLFSTSVFPRDFTKAVEKHLREDFGGAQTSDPSKATCNDTFLSPSEEENLKTSMKKYAGDRFIQEYENLMEENSVDSKRMLAKSMINLIKQQFIKLKEIEAQYVTPNFEQYKQVTELKPPILDLSADTPCNTEAECKKLENMMNICSYVRGGADFAYDIFLVTTHVVTIMMAVKASTVLCRVYGGGVSPLRCCAVVNFFATPSDGLNEISSLSITKVSPEWVRRKMKQMANHMNQKKTDSWIKTVQTNENRTF
ncbi:conserved Plasmodium protein, unknown function [Plasmodium ovale curtisi]|uniref:PIR Superfamily Protein n=1 Tax=Plasmodium ovale curtisi TaxID=864141 RepID=A0A1A8WXG7_PLAOA|nr:conserved Plasmodium protein, unknown function [Plasmodium ovale curtisi]